MNELQTIKCLWKIITYYYNEYIGGNENAFLDGNEYTPFTEEQLIETITKEIMTNDLLPMEDSFYCIEGKHIRFMGRKFIKSCVYAECHRRHEEDGLWEWEVIPTSNY